MPMSTSVKFFSSAMLNAPQITGTLGSLISVLDACLVDGWNLITVDSVSVSAGIATANIAAGHGFGKWQVVQVAGGTPSGLNGEHRVTEVTTNTVKFEAPGVADGSATGTITLKTAPAGWVKAFAGTNKGAYKVDQTKYPTSTGMLVRVHHDTAYGARVVGYETMSGIDTGTGQFPQNAQIAGGLGIALSENGSTSDPRGWFIVADDRMVYLGTLHYGSYATTSVGPSWSAFGEYKSVRSADAFNFLVAANSATSYSGGAPGDDLQFCNNIRTERQYLPRTYDNLGGAIRFTTRSWPSQYGASGGSGAPMPYPNGPDNGVYLGPLDIFEVDNSNYSTHLRGTYPGVLMIPHRVTSRIVSDTRTPYLDNAVAGQVGKVIGFYPLYTNNGSNGVVAFDLVGPWEH